jgi:hypothetical protein
LEKLSEHKPRILCFVGLGITQIVKKQLTLVRISVILTLSTIFVDRKIQNKQQIRPGSDAEVKNSVLESRTRTGTSSPSTSMYGLQPFKMVHESSGKNNLTLDQNTHDLFPLETLFFAVASTSGRVVQYQVSFCFL